MATVWIDTGLNETSWGAGGLQYPLQTDTHYEDLIDFDFALMTYDGVLLSDPGWMLGSSLNTSWAIGTAPTNSWTPGTPPETTWA